MVGKLTESESEMEEEVEHTTELTGPTTISLISTRSVLI
jgi:hypothetical protein